MQAKIYEFLKSQKNDTKIFVTKDFKKVFDIGDVCKYLGYKTFIFPEIRVGFGEDLRAYKDEFDKLYALLNEFYKEKSSKKIIISPFSTLLHPLPKNELFQELLLEFAATLNIQELKDKLFYWGYSFVDIVQEKGEVSFRGDIIDIFPVTLANPIRISLFDDEIESIRYFESQTQKSFKNELEEVKIPPANFSFTKEQYKIISQKVQNLQSDSFEKDISSLGFWVLDEVSEYFPLKFDSYLCENIDEEFEEFKSFYPDIKDIREYLKYIPEPKVYKDVEVIDVNSFLGFHADKQIKILAKNDAIVKSSFLDTKYIKSLDDFFILSISA